VAARRSLVIVHLYPAHMNLYGDRGNVLALRRRAEWRGFDVTVEDVDPGDPLDLSRVDLLFIGGGEDRHQELVAEDFAQRGPDLAEAFADGLPALAVCGGYQLLGHRYEAADGRGLPGVGWFDLETRNGVGRAVGDIVIETGLELEPRTLVGFENHGGRTYLAAGQGALGRVLSGQGNNGQDGTEGAVRGRVLGTYLHGSLLPKNPQLADWLLSQARAYRTGTEDLEPLDAVLELRAHAAMVERLIGGRRG
jgi:CobQ-like glutamine amidotransferase family enzyme